MGTGYTLRSHLQEIVLLWCTTHAVDIWMHLQSWAVSFVRLDSRSASPVKSWQKLRSQSWRRRIWSTRSGRNKSGIGSAAKRNNWEDARLEPGIRAGVEAVHTLNMKAVVNSAKVTRTEVGKPMELLMGLFQSWSRQKCWNFKSRWWLQEKGLPIHSHLELWFWWSVEIHEIQWNSLVSWYHDLLLSAETV